jgi:hypothetical protein
VHRLTAEPAIRRIYQWGSPLDETHFSTRSDLDIAIEGELDAATNTSRPRNDTIPSSAAIFAVGIGANCVLASPHLPIAEIHIC